MFRRLRDAIKEKKEEYRQAKEFKSKKNYVAENLQVVGRNWRFVEESLLFEDPTVLCICHVLLTVLFWVFLTSAWRLAAVAVDGCLVAVSLSSELKRIWWNNLQSYFHLQIEDSRLGFAFEDVCCCLATAWVALDDGINYAALLKEKAPHKLALIVGLHIIAVLFVVAYVPLTQVLYGGGSLLLFYLPLKHYGILHRISERIHRFIEPALIQWQHNRTRRRRDGDSAVPEFDTPFFEDESEDEFALDPSHATSEIMSAAVTDDHFDMSDSLDLETEDAHGLAASYGSHSSGEDGFHGDGLSFAPGLTSMPSLSHYDSLMEPADDFHHGLNFPDHDASSAGYPMATGYPLATMYPLATATSEALTDDDADSLPCDDVTDNAMARREDNGFEFVEHADVVDLDQNNAMSEDAVERRQQPIANFPIQESTNDGTRSQWLGY